MEWKYLAYFMTFCLLRIRIFYTMCQTWVISLQQSNFLEICGLFFSYVPLWSLITPIRFTWLPYIIPDKRNGIIFNTLSYWRCLQNWFWSSDSLLVHVWHYRAFQEVSDACNAKKGIQRFVCVVKTLFHSF